MLQSNALVVFVAYSSALCNRKPSSHSNKRACISQLMLLLNKTPIDSARSGSNLVSFLRFVSIANAARVGFNLMAAFLLWQYFYLYSQHGNILLPILPSVVGAFSSADCCAPAALHL